ncbi:N-acetylmuramic acid 6-phosphate etherase [Rhizocola hellebori]|uniref:N-acetylmuramic acid 6-phosphate etherase n=1 Tax=Rhizocola hellebori TaxID=1392758 RepID=A0A8J3VMT8_9ACTN|nr:N-acetylmuramic acid 6-phosphate etherase [Rhizocola hellebori]GIH11711.1 N-acetylmuramic acid 6-phosphate etherase [Rhizocola hellebori]
MEALDSLLTEQVDERYANVDTASVEQLAALMNDADATVPVAVRLALPQIVPAIEAITERLRSGGRLIYLGAGSAGRICVLDAAECPPTFNVTAGLVSAIMAGGYEALVDSVEGAEDDGPAGQAAVEAFGVTEADAVVGVTASGRTPYVLTAMRAAKNRGALTVGLSCNENTALSAEVAFPIEVAVGPEVLAGSTRLKAGTAQKMVLNMISTIVMTRLGKVYGNLMVDMRVTNGKLRDRALRIIERVTRCSRATADAALEAADLEVKTAIVTILKSSSVEAARQRLAAVGGRLRDALEAPA